MLQLAGKILENLFVDSAFGVESVGVSRVFPGNPSLPPIGLQSQGYITTRRAEQGGVMLERQ